MYYIDYLHLGCYEFLGAVVTIAFVGICSLIWCKMFHPMELPEYLVPDNDYNDKKDKG